jgi:thiamine-phosphate pyrophosphorylase
MPRRHPLPTIWLMTDPRIDDLGAAIRRLPRGAGIVFRHYHLSRADRRALFDEVHKLAKARRLVLLLADRPLVARQWGADGAHDGSAHRSQGIRTVAVHNAREAASARRIGADLLFVSPIFMTQSHPGARGIGALGLGQIAGNQRRRTIALGGMTAKRRQSLSAINIHGWAAIDAFRT